MLIFQYMYHRGFQSFWKILSCPRTLNVLCVEFTFLRQKNLFYIHKTDRSKPELFENVHTSTDMGKNNFELCGKHCVHLILAPIQNYSESHLPKLPDFPANTCDAYSQKTRIWFGIVADQHSLPLGYKRIWCETKRITVHSLSSPKQKPVTKTQNLMFLNACPK